MNNSTEFKSSSIMAKDKEYAHIYFIYDNVQGLYGFTPFSNGLTPMERLGFRQSLSHTTTCIFHHIYFPIFGSQPHIGQTHYSNPLYVVLISHNTFVLRKEKCQSWISHPLILTIYIYLCDVKYLLSSFDGDVLSLLPLVVHKAPSTYGRSMNNMNKMCNSYPLVHHQTYKIQIDFRLSFRHFTVYVISNGMMVIVIICISIMVCARTPNRSVHLFSHFMWVMLPLVDLSNIQCRVCRPTHLCIILCHAPIICIHSTSIMTSRACIPFGVHDHHVANGKYHESSNMTY